jgi:ABC-type uncharacterized transport system permease subunit
MEDTSLGLWGVPLAMLAGAIRVSTPFIFVSVGECLTERSGRINLGLEGTLVMGAMSGYGVARRGSACWSRAASACCSARCMPRSANCRGSTTSPPASA